MSPQASQEVEIKTIVIAGTKSGCGKTTVSLGLLAALAGRGLKVAPFKVGPDFIDAGHHSRVAGVAARNLDGWMLSKQYNLDTFARCAADADVAVVEGVMGLFDGYDGKSEAGSSAQMAKWLGAPVVLLVDAASMARSAAAVVLGFERFDAELTFAGVIFNNLGSPRHLQFLKEALGGHVAMPCLGGILRREDIGIPERHLGLVTREDHPLSRDGIQRLADLIEESVDLESLLDGLAETTLPGPDRDKRQSGQPDKKVRIGIARDNAFCFYYEDNFEWLQNMGAKLVFFSPLADRNLPADLDGLYFGGGYPELFGAKLAANAGMRNRIKENSLDGMPIYGECGGFMYLCETLIDLNGDSFPMSGCFPFTTRMLTRLKALGYREITLTHDTVIGHAGMTLRGHEFHYSERIGGASRVPAVFAVSDRAGVEKSPEGFTTRHTLGSYHHLHFGSQPDAAGCFVANCRQYRQARNTIDET